MKPPSTSPEQVPTAVNNRPLNKAGPLHKDEPLNQYRASTKAAASDRDESPDTDASVDKDESSHKDQSLDKDQSSHKDNPSNEYNFQKQFRWWREVGWRHVIGILAIIYCLVPLLYILSTSLSSHATLSGSNQLFSEVSLQNYAKLSGTDFWHWVVNSLVIASTTALGATFMGACAAYAFSRFRFRGRRATLTFLLVVQIFPQMLAFVAIFLLLLGLSDVFPVLGLNSQLGLIAVYLGGALGSNTFLLYGFFNTIPQELDEAAKIDGATHAQVFWQIIMRLVTPILAVVFLLAFITAFGDFVLAKVVLQTPDKFTLAIGMYNWASDARNAPWGVFAAGAVVSAVPVVLLFQFLQKYIVSGLTSGSVKT